MQTSVKPDRQPGSGADAFARVLREQGVERIFSVMGNQVNDIAFALRDVGIELITCRHEGSATMMAEAYARVSRRIGVVLVIPGPGVSNTASGLLEAKMNCSPVLVVSVRQPSRFAHRPADKLFHGLDHCRFAQAVSGYSATVATQADFELHLQRTFDILGAGRPRPVFLEFAVDFLRGRFHGPALTVKPVIFPEVEAQPLAQALQLIASSRRVLLVAGRAVIASGAQAALASLARQARWPVLTTTLGKGAFPERDPLYMGKLYEPACRELIADADLVIAVGTRFSQVDTEDWHIPLSAPILQIDSEPEEFNSTYPVDVALCGDLACVLDMLRERLVAPSQDWDLPALRRDIAQQRGPLPCIAAVLHEVLAPGDVLAVDVHEQGYPLVEHFLADDQAFLFSGTSLCLGYGIPAAVGARLATARGRVVAFCGDGGFLMSSAELATAAQLELAIVFVIVNDHAFGTIKNHQLRHYGATTGVELSNPDFSLLTHSFGFSYRAVKDVDDLQAVLHWALEQSAPTVVEIDKHLLVQPE